MNQKCLVCNEITKQYDRVMYHCNTCKNSYDFQSYLKHKKPTMTHDQRQARALTEYEQANNPDIRKYPDIRNTIPKYSEIED